MPRFTIAQLLVLIVLVGIIAGFVRATGDHAAHDAIYGATFSPDGTRLAVMHESGCAMWDLREQPPRRTRLALGNGLDSRDSAVIGFVDDTTVAGR